MHLRSWLLALTAAWFAAIAVTPSLAVEPAPAVDDGVLRRHLEAQGYECVDLTRTQSGYFVVAATLEGRPLSLIVDSGAPCAHLDVARLRASGIPWPKSVGRTKEEVGNLLAFFESTRIGHVSTGRLLAVPDDLSASNERLEACDERPVDGFLGGDVLIAHAAVIDLAKRRLFLRATRVSRDAPVARELHDAVGKELVARGYACADLDRNAGMYLATAGKIENKDLRLMVDTGAPATYLDRRRTEVLNLKWHPLDRRSTPQAPLSQYAFSSVNLLRVQSIAVGPLQIWSTESLTAVNASIAGLGGDPFDGLLGADVLNAGAAVIDYATQRLYLKPPPR